MAVRLGEEIEVNILVGDEEVRAVFPSYTDEGMAEAIKKLSSGRSVVVRGQAKDRTHEARVKFFNATCLRVENVEASDGTPLTPDMQGWRSQIPPNWKASFAIYFEERATLSEDEVGN